MKKIFQILSLPILFSPFFLSCERPPDLPDKPKIDFRSVQFVESTGTQAQDTLKITVAFEDGDGNLGLSQFDVDEPFHEVTYFNREDPRQRITNLNTFQGELLKLGDKPGGLDTLPPYNQFDQPFGIDCINYRVLNVFAGDSLVRVDTVYIQLNENNSNFFLDVLVNQNGEFNEFDFLKETCVPVDGRFQILNTSDNERPLEGELTYKFRIFRLKRFLADDTLQLRIRIKDRALNESNTVLSPEFTLDGIKVN